MWQKPPYMARRQTSSETHGQLMLERTGFLNIKNFYKSERRKSNKSLGKWATKMNTLSKKKYMWLLKEKLKDD